MKGHVLFDLASRPDRVSEVYRLIESVENAVFQLEIILVGHSCSTVGKLFVGEADLRATSSLPT